jgi:hypothetical protein
MRTSGVCPLLIKGPVLERWLYRDGTECRYGDVDLVVSPDRFSDAEAALAELGFAPRLDVSVHIGLPDHEHEWVRHPHSIDLHRGIWGLDRDPGALWGLLTEKSDRIEIVGTTIEVRPRPRWTIICAPPARRRLPAASSVWLRLPPDAPG